MNIKKILILLSGIFLFAHLAISQPEIIAHRGFWNTEKSAQNSIKAMKLADKAKVYGSEFDVILTRDGVPVVNHDPEIEGFNIEETNYETLKNLRLSNGEKLPTLKKFLTQGRRNQFTRLILEIKPHRSEKNELRAVETIVKMVKNSLVTGKVDYISFSLFICEELRRLSPESEIYYLNGDLSPEEIYDLGFTGLDYNSKVFLENPDWIERARELGLKTNVWTVNNEEQMIRFMDMGVDFITTDNPLLLKEIIMSEY
ncbi:MAG: glycerophosphodiester phosphodiesterase [Tannerella sp.]|jgi:glycerophosphoryl diester phosphodiesterase|nr:glycerophosphodiester phosphodiesterase [Tannerella sp.]